MFLLSKKSLGLIFFKVNIDQFRHKEIQPTFFKKNSTDLSADRSLFTTFLTVMCLLPTNWTSSVITTPECIFLSWYTRQMLKSCDFDIYIGHHLHSKVIFMEIMFLLYTLFLHVMSSFSSTLAYLANSRGFCRP